MSSLPDQAKEVASQLVKYCSYRDRCIKEVREKMAGSSLSEKNKEKVLAFLLEHKFLDERRYASAFTRGKFNQNKWGKRKISYELQRNGIDADTIEIALKEINDENYQGMIERLIISHAGKKLGHAQQREKTVKYLLGKGYAANEIKAVWDSIVRSLG